MKQMEKIQVLFVLILTLLLTSCKQDATGPPATPASVAPTITQHPSNVTLMVGQSATFTVKATGTAPLSYQWQKDGANISGATSANYSLIVSSADSGKTFLCVVSNTAGSAASNPAILNAVSAPTLPVITGHPPTNISAFAGDTITVSVSATGYPFVSYQWRKDGINVSGATSASYTFVALYADSGKQFQCVVSNSAGSVVSNPVFMSVIQLIEIGRPMNGGVICYVDGTGQHGLYFKYISRKRWQGALDTAGILGGTVPTVSQLQTMLYPNKVRFGLHEVNYWSCEESPTDNRFAISVDFNYSPQYNGSPIHTPKQFLIPFVVLFQF